MKRNTLNLLTYSRRANGSVLDLWEADLDKTLKENSASITLADDIVPSVAIHEDTRNVHVLVLTASRTLHRFTFLHPSVCAH